jgi:co-chaperonin GroES (HSP10)|tara:strand:+ start:1972 stop:2322 length:351 start_codon:yes stop_codon:yes gene_type:complete
MAHPHVPQPVGWKVLVQPIEPKKQTSGGIYLPDETVDAEEYLVAHGNILAMGDLAYHDRETGNIWKGTWPKINDHVTFGRYAGQKLIIDNKKLLLLNDDEITAIIPENCEISTYAA